MKKTILITLLFLCALSCKKERIEKEVIKQFINEIYMTSEVYNKEKVCKYLTHSDVEILNKLSVVKKKYLKYIVEFYQAEYKKLKGELEVVHYNDVNKDLLKDKKIIVNDFADLYCVINNNQIISVFIIEKSNNEKIYIKSFSHYIPSVGGKRPIILKEFKSYPDPILKID
jgi:hypothetical protein